MTTLLDRPCDVQTLEGTADTTPLDEFEVQPRACWRVVARREIGMKLRDRGFLVSTLVTLGLIVGAIALSLYLSTARDTVTVAVSSDAAGTLVEMADHEADEAGTRADLETTRVADDDAVRAAVRSGEAALGLVQGPGGWVLVAPTSPDPQVSQHLGSAVAGAAVQQNAVEQGVSLRALQEGAGLSDEVLDGSAPSRMVVLMTTGVFGMLFYVATVLLGVALATSIVEEKQNRIVEVVAGSTRVRDLLSGKVVGITVVALGQMVLFSVAAVGGLAAAGKTHLLTRVGPGVAWFLAFFLVGVAVLAAVYAAAGSLATRSEDIQSVTTPVTMVTALAFIAGTATSGLTATVLSFVPLVSTVAMPGRIVAGETQWWEPLVSLLLSGLSAVLFLRGSERVYHQALLQTSRRLSLRQAWSARA